MMYDMMYVGKRGWETFDDAFGFDFEALQV
jgi:hypothetical protein